MSVLDLVVVAAVISVLASLFLPAVSASREAARVAECMNRMRQTSMAVSLLVESQRSYPSVFADLPWTVQILPHLEQSALYMRARNAVADADAMLGTNVAATELSVFQCASLTSERDNLTSAVLGCTAINWEMGAGLRRQFCSDGESNTVLLCETNLFRTPWIAGPARSVEPLDSAHSTPLLAFADGSVRRLSNYVDADTLKAMGTPDGGELVNF
jgi:type II secretory pathway pseudopilin PulG